MVDFAKAVRKIGAQGFRFDAIKHIDESFISKFVTNTREKSGYPKLFAVGEYWKDSIDDLDTYLAQFGTQFSVFDTPLHYNFKRAGEAGNSYDMRQIFDNTVVQRRPIDAVTLVDNHDTQVGQALESCVPSWFKPLAYSLILLRPDGYP
jgi:alpha-amylase